MRFSTYINNQKSLEWGLNANQAALFDLLNQASSWAEEVVVDGVVYYWVSRNKVIEELPLFYKTGDTVYRHFSELNKKGLIVYLKQGKHGDKDLIRLTEKGKSWNEFKPEQIRDNSEINPNKQPELEKLRKKIRLPCLLNLESLVSLLKIFLNSEKPRAHQLLRLHLKAFNEKLPRLGYRFLTQSQSLLSVTGADLARAGIGVMTT